MCSTDYLKKQAKKIFKQFFVFEKKKDPIKWHKKQTTSTKPKEKYSVYVPMRIFALTKMRKNQQKIATNEITSELFPWHLVEIIERNVIGLLMTVE